MDIDREAVREHVRNAGIVFGLWKTIELGVFWCTVVYIVSVLLRREICFLMCKGRSLKTGVLLHVII